MLRKIILAVGLAMLLNVDAAVSAPPEADLTILPNGFQVLVAEDARFPLAAIRLYVHAGSAYEDAEKAGISHVLEHMVFKGTKKRGPGEVAGDIEAVGGSINAATSFDYTVYTADLPAEHWKLGLDVVKDMVFGSVFDPEELSQELNVVISELERNEDNPGRRVFKVLQSLVWGGTAYESPIIGFRDTVSEITSRDLHRYIGRLYQPGSMLLVVVGKVDKAEVLAEAGRLFGSLTNDQALTPPTPWAVPVGEGPRIEVETGPWQRAYVNVAFPIPEFMSDESIGLDVLAHIMGGDKTSSLYRKFKYDLQLVDSISAYALTLERGGMFVISATMDPDNVDAYWRGLIEELSGLDAQNFTDQEIERAKLNLEDSLFMSRETLGGLASKLGFFQFFTGSTAAEQNYLYNLRHVTREELSGLVRTYLRPEALNTALLLPEGVNITPEILARAVSQQWPPSEVSAKAEALADLDAEQTEVIELPGGNSLVLLPDNSLPYVSVTVAWQGGDLLLGPRDQGLAELTAGALTRGTKDKSANEIQDFLSDRAASLNFNAGKDQFVMSSKFPNKFADDMYGLILEAVAQPAFDHSEIERAVKDQIASIKKREDQPLGLAFRYIFDFLYRDHPYSYLHAGLAERLPEYNSTHIRGFWDKQARMPWVMAVCGQMDKDRVLGLARSLDEMGRAGSLTMTGPKWGEKRELTLSLADRNQVHLLLIFPVPGLGEKQDPGLSLLESVLAGQSGLLFRSLRDEQGLGYTVTAFVWQAPKAGFMAFYIGTTPDMEQAALQGFEDVIAGLKREPLPEDELTRAKNVIKGDYYRDHQGLSARSGEAAVNLARGLDVHYERGLLDKIEKLTPEDIRRLAEQYLDLDKSYLLKVEPK